MIRELEATGLEVGAVVGHLAGAWLPFDAIDDVPARDDIIRFLRPEYPRTVGGTTIIGDNPAAPGEAQFVPGEVVIGLRTVGKIDDFGAYVETLQWPSSIGPVTSENVQLVYSIPEGSEFLTVGVIRLLGEISVDRAAGELEQLDFIEYATPNYAAGPEDPPSDPAEETVKMISPVNPRELDHGLIIPGEVVVAFRTETEITDLGSYLDSHQWPPSIGTVNSENVELLRVRHDQEGKFITVVLIRFSAESDVLQAVSDLEELDFVEYAKPNYKLHLDDATDEGRAMLQIVHDVAPGADLLEASGDLAKLSSTDLVDFAIWLYDFATVHAHSRNGGTDTVDRTDPLDFQLYLYGDWDQ